MQFKLEIRLGNAEMLTAEHVADAIDTVAETLNSDYAGHDMTLEELVASGALRNGEHLVIRDVNGNVVGHWEIAP